MCSVGDDNFEEDAALKVMQERETIKAKDSKCNKCRESQANVVLRGKDAYCKTCFLASTTHKFKAFLGKHRLVYPNDKVLILHQPGHASTALLHFLRAGLVLSTPKRLRFEPILLFIEDREDLPVSQRQDILNKVKKEAERFMFPIYFVNIEEYVRYNGDLASSLHCNIEYLNVNKDGVINKHSVMNKNGAINKDDTSIMERSAATSRPNNSHSLTTIHNDYKSILKRNLLLKAAKHLNCACVFVPDVALDLASQLLTNISLGRGNSLSLDVGVCDVRDPDVKIIRPLRMYDIKELAYYNVFNGLEPVSTYKRNPGKLLGAGNYGRDNSVQRLMRTFVENLQANYPATITTVAKTGEKLALDANNVSSEVCNLCKGPKDLRSEDLGSAESTNFSHWVSTQTPNYELSRVERYNELLETFQKSYDNSLCFACRRIPV